MKNNPNILIVEDEGIVAQSMQAVLDELGYGVCGIAPSGERAEEMAKTLCPDLILMDIRLIGRQDGIEVAQNIRRLYDIPVIYLTAYADDETFARAIETEPYGFLIKPFESQRLYMAIEIALYRKRAERALHESEERNRRLIEELKDSELKYRELVDQSLTAVYRVSLDGRILFVNRAFLGMFDYSSVDEALSDNILSTYKSPEQRESLIARLRKDGKITDVELEIRTRTGRSGYILINSTLAGDVVSSTALDITARKKNEGLLHNIADTVSSKTGVELLNSLSRFIASELGAEQVVLGEFMSRTRLRAMAVHGDFERPAPFELDLDLSGFPCQDEGYCFVSEGAGALMSSDSALWFHGMESLISITLRTSGDEPLGVIIAAGKKAISTEDEKRFRMILQIFSARASAEIERMRAEETLRLREEALASVYSIVTSKNLTFVEVCTKVALAVQRLLRVTNVMIHTLDSDRLTLIASVQDGKVVDEEVLEDDANACKAMEMGKDVYIWSDRSGEQFVKGTLLDKYRPKSSVCLPILNVGGAPVGVICALNRDEYEYNPDAMQLMRIFASYISFEAERQQMDAMLRDAQKMEVVGKLAGGVAHEVRNPLNAIMAISDALDRDLKGNPEHAQLMFHMRAQVERLTVLMRDLLELGKPIDKTSLQVETLCNICFASIDLWHHSALSGEHEVSIVRDPDVCGVQVLADPKKLQQVFLNLIENSAQHSPPGAPIRIDIMSCETNRVCVRVVDAGTGIQEDMLPRVFDTFFTTRRGGTGLGLSIVKHIMDLHNAKVRIYNNTGGPGCTAEVIMDIAGMGV